MPIAPTKIRIALTGSPNSGKSELAIKLGEHFDIRVIDNYVQELSDRTDLHLSYATHYVPNMLVMYERLVREMDKPHDFITVGTAIDTMAYCALWSSHIKESSSPDEIQSDSIKAAVFMNAINLTLDDCWRYNHVFYMPTKGGSKMNRELDYAIREVLATLSIDHTPLTDEDQFAQALDVIRDTSVETPATEE